MKKILCYLGILFLLFLLVLPPALRIFLKDKEDPVEEDITKATLVCQNDTFVTNTNYENDEVKMIVIKKINGVVDSNGNVLGDNTKSDIEKELDINPLYNLVDTLKDKEGVNYNKTNEFEAIALNFTNNKYDDLDLSLITKPLVEQKDYYEYLQLVCITR